MIGFNRHSCIVQPFQLRQASAHEGCGGGGGRRRGRGTRAAAGSAWGHNGNITRSARKMLDSMGFI